ncbi:hypothetical protein K523DRAFT_358680, partial [Schizophyllum commune Tattone D]
PESNLADSASWPSTPSAISNNEVWAGAMAWYSPYGDQNSAWHGGYHDPRSQFPVAARQSPCDPEYGYSRPLYTNYGGYSTPANPAVAQPSQGREPAWLRESRRQDEAWEHRHDVRLASQVCTPDRGNTARAPKALPAQTTATRITAATAKGASDHARFDTGEEAARQITPAATPPPARPARSAARTPPPPIPPRSTRPRIDTRNDDARVGDTTWQEPPPARHPPPPARPPPRPARAAARRPNNPAHIEHPPDALPYATSARATSLGDADRTAPTNDRSSLPSTSTTTAPPTRPLPSIATSSPSQALPPPPTPLYGPRAPPVNPNHRVARADPGDVLQDVGYLHAIANYVEGGEERNSQRMGGEDARMRSVRGTLFHASQSTNRQIPRDRAPSRAIGTLARTTTTPAATAGYGQREHGGRVETATLTPPLRHHDRDASGETRESKASRGTAVPSSREMATRKNECDTRTTASHSPRSILKPPQPPTLRSLPLRPVLSSITHPPPTLVDVHVPPPHSPQSIARREGTFELPAIPSSLPHEITVPSTSHRRGELRDVRGGREGEEGGRSATTRPGNTSYALAHRIPQYHSTKEGGPQFDPATSMPPLPCPPRSRPALSKHPTPTPRPVLLHAPVYSTQSTMRDGSASERAAQIEVSTTSSTGMHDRMDSRVSIPLALATARTHSVAMAQDVPDSHAEYTSVGNAHFARAPAAVHSTRQAAGDYARQGGGGSHRRNGGFSGGNTPLSVHRGHSLSFAATHRRSRNGPPPHTMQLAPLGSPPQSMPLHDLAANPGVFSHATTHPPLSASFSRARPPPPPPLFSTISPSHAIPPPPGWPFPLSVEEMGWVLAAVVMARRMEQEDEETGCDEYDNYDFVAESEDGTNNNELSPHGPVVLPDPEVDGHLIEYNYANVDPDNHEYASTASGSASPTPATTFNVVDFELDNADEQNWGEASSSLSDELDEGFVDPGQSEDEYWDDDVSGEH